MSEGGATDVDLAIVGAGLAGAASAWAASRRGLSVALFEQYGIGHHHGSSHGSARIFRRAYPDELYVRLSGESAELWRELEHDTGTTLVRATGGLDHGSKRGLELIDGYLTAASVPHELLDPLEAGHRWPGMRFETSVVFHPGAGVIDASAAVVACVEAAKQKGAVVHDHTLVTGIIPAGGHVVVCAASRIWRARRALVAAGAWVADVLPHALPSPRVEVTQQQVFHFPRRDLSVNWPVFVHHDRMFTYGLPGGRDGGAQNALKVGEHGGGQVTTASTRDGVVDAAARVRIVEYVKAWLPGLIPEPFNETTCLYTSTADEDFVLDRRGALIICSACSGHGAKFAPWLGTEVAKLAAGEGAVQERFRLDRPGLLTGN